MASEQTEMIGGEPAASAAPRRGLARRLLWLDALVLVLGVGLWYGVAGARPEWTVRQLIRASARGDKAGVKARVTKRSLYIAERQAGHMSMLPGAHERGPVSVGKAVLKGDEARVVVSRQRPGQQPELVTYVLRREDGRWRVDVLRTLEASVGDALRKLPATAKKAVTGK
jgi:hypothetical protein